MASLTCADYIQQYGSPNDKNLVQQFLEEQEKIPIELFEQALKNAACHYRDMPATTTLLRGLFSCANAGGGDQEKVFDIVNFAYRKTLERSIDFKKHDYSHVLDALREYRPDDYSYHDDDGL